MTKPNQTTIGTMIIINTEDIMVKDDPMVEVASTVEANIKIISREDLLGFL